MKVFVSWSVDQVEGLIASSLMSDNVEELRQMSQDLKHAADNLKAWSMAVGGSPILDLGISGAVEVPADRMTELPAIAEKFAAAADATMSVGVGMTLSESYTAMRFSALKGGDQISLYHQEMEDFVSGAQKEPEDPLMELGKSGEKGQEEPVGFADGPSDSAGGEGGAQHGGPSPQEGNSPVGSNSVASAGDPGSVSVDMGSQSDANGGGQQPGGAEGEQGEEDPRSAVVKALQQIKQQAPVLEQMKQTNPEAFEAVHAVVEAMIMMAQGMAMDGESEGAPSAGGGESTSKSELEKTDLPGGAAAPKPAVTAPSQKAAAMPSAPKPMAAAPAPGKAATAPMMGATGAPALHSSVESFTGAFGKLPKGSPERGKLAMQHMNHKPLADAFAAHPTHAGLWGSIVKLGSQYGNSVANAGLQNGAKATIKNEFAVGTQKDGKIKVEHKDIGTNADGGSAWRSVRAGQIMSEDGHAVSARNPGSK